VTSLGEWFNDPASPTLSTFAYSPAGQLSAETRSNDAYAWKGSVAANRDYAANGQNQYTSAGAATFDYDPNGNLLSSVNAPWSAGRRAVPGRLGLRVWAVVSSDVAGCVRP
jgi:hypothetical protein